jgi:DNA polymerase-3 subunit delta'
MHIVGHSKQIKYLNNILKSENISQAYLFVGPEGVGKFSLAKLFAEALNKGFAEMNEDNFLKKLKNIDVDILEPEVVEKKSQIKYKNIEIDDLREAQKNLSLYPSAGKKRLLIINNAHSMTISSQNSILKTLEEPSSTAIIILVTHREGDILETIKSRCQKTNFGLVALSEIKEGFLKKVPDSEIEKVVMFSMGRPGEAEKIIEDKKYLKEKNDCAEELKNIVGMSVLERMDMAERYSKNIPESVGILEFWVWLLRLQAFKSVQDQQRVRIYYKAIKAINESLDKLKNPSYNSRLILENLFLDL